MAELLHSTAQPQEGAVAELAELAPDHPPQPVEQLAMPQPGGGPSIWGIEVGSLKAPESRRGACIDAEVVLWE